MTEEKITYYERNKEKCKAQAVAYQEANKEKYKAYFKDYYQKNKERLKAKHKAYVEKNKQTIYKKHRESYYPKNYAKQKQERLTGPVVLDKIEAEPAITFVKQEGSFTLSWE